MTHLQLSKMLNQLFIFHTQHSVGNSSSSKDVDTELHLGCFKLGSEKNWFSLQRVSIGILFPISSHINSFLGVEKDLVVSVTPWQRKTSAKHHWLVLAQVLGQTLPHAAGPRYLNCKRFGRPPRMALVDGQPGTGGVASTKGYAN